MTKEKQILNQTQQRYQNEGKKKKTNLWHFSSSVTQKNYTQSPKTLTKKKEKKKEITKPTNENNPTMLSQKLTITRKRKL